MYGPPAEPPDLGENLGEIVQALPLTGGYDHQAWLLTRRDGSQVVLKTGEVVPPGLFAAEAEGLDAIRATGAVATPRVLQAASDYLILESLRPAPDDGSALWEHAAFWEHAGRAVATLHAVRGPAYGWHHDNWLGLLPQYNAWCQDGYEFFIRHRIVRFLPEPRLRTVLDEAARAAIERICFRLHDLVPPMPPALCHGDLWQGNFLATAQGRPALIDAAVSFVWREVDLSMMYCTGRAPERFFAAYHEIHPPESGWRERMELLHLRELLSLLAIHGDGHRHLLPRVHHVISTYS